ncbi:hypothetical protein C8R48DRAFT_686180 [Suillus tomentosus]|nr:hypothetical protein C8R48DRAFT_686180 [Suillus tomentosus]
MRLREDLNDLERSLVTRFANFRMACLSRLRGWLEFSRTGASQVSGGSGLWSLLVTT